MSAKHVSESQCIYYYYYVQQLSSVSSVYVKFKNVFIVYRVLGPTFIKSTIRSVSMASQKHYGMLGVQSKCAFRIIEFLAFFPLYILSKILYQFVMRKFLQFLIFFLLILIEFLIFLLINYKCDILYTQKSKKKYQNKKFLKYKRVKQKKKTKQKRITFKL